MNPAKIARDTLVAACADFGAKPVGSAWIHLETLGLHVKVKTASKQKGEAMSLYIATVDTYIDCSALGMQVTCVGFASDLEEAARNAVAQWALGVLPVLAYWRKKDHNCFVSEETIELHTPGGKKTFDVLEGPVIGRGESEGMPEEPPSQAKHLDLMHWHLQRELLGDDTHWIECYAVRMADKSVDATVRVDNIDWEPGKTLLKEDARTWPGTTPSMQSFRQFVLLHPQGMEQPTPKPPSFLQRLFG